MKHEQEPVCILHIILHFKLIPNASLDGIRGRINIDLI